METNTFDKSNLSSYYRIDLLLCVCVSSFPWWALSAEKTKVSDLVRVWYRWGVWNRDNIPAFHIDYALSSLECPWGLEDVIKHVQSQWRKC